MGVAKVTPMEGHHFFLLFALLVSIHSGEGGFNPGGNQGQNGFKPGHTGGGQGFNPGYQVKNVSEPEPCKGCVEKIPITGEIYSMAKYAVAELDSKKPGYLGNTQCKYHYINELDHILEAKKQVVEAGTKYIFTLRVSNVCDETKAICTNLELSLSIGCDKAEDKYKCAKITGTPQCNSTSTMLPEPGKLCLDHCERHLNHRKCMEKCCSNWIAKSQQEKCRSVECGQNEEYRMGGTGCPRTCQNKDRPIICHRKGVSGCFCREGYILLSRFWGRCISEKSCPECDANEKFDEYSANCQDICGEGPGPCPYNYASGCVCDTGYIRANRTSNGLGPCIPKQECNGGTGVDCMAKCYHTTVCNTSDCGSQGPRHRACLMDCFGVSVGHNPIEENPIKRH